MSNLALLKEYKDRHYSVNQVKLNGKEKHIYDKKSHIWIPTRGDILSYKGRFKSAQHSRSSNEKK